MNRSTTVGGLSQWGTGSHFDPLGYIDPVEHYVVEKQLTQFNSLKLDRPTGICSSANGEILYLSDSFNYRVMSYNIVTKELKVIAGDPNGELQGFQDASY